MRTPWTHKIATLIYLEILFKERCCSLHIGHNFFFFNFQYKYIYLNWSLIALQYYLYWFCHTSAWMCHWCALVPHPEPPCHLHHHTIPAGYPRHQPRASCNMLRTWTGGLFDIWYYTCFSAILPNHATLTVSRRPEDCSIHLCLFYILVYIVIITIFLNSTYMH